MNHPRRRRRNGRGSWAPGALEIATRIGNATFLSAAARKTNRDEAWRERRGLSQREKKRNQEHLEGGVFSGVRGGGWIHTYTHTPTHSHNPRRKCHRAVWGHKLGSLSKIIN